MGDRWELLGDEQLGSYGDRGNLAEFGKKRNTDHDIPPPLYVGGK